VLNLDVQLKFWELLFGLVAAGIVVIGVVYMIASVMRRRIKPPLYIEAGGVVLSVGEEKLLERIACAEDKDRNLFALARALNADEISVYAVTRELKRKDLVVEIADLSGGGPRFELSENGSAAALARNYIKLAL
jgi:hypothetical protein